ncbi:MAG: sigma-54-dependent transcriptional regulator [Thiotrichales bacterium]
MTAQHILIVDDEPEILSSVRDILEDEGFEVSVAESAAGARARREERTPDLVFLDIWMPGEDGVSLLRDWKEREGLPFPVVMMSGHGTVETAVEATRLGAFDFIEKPLSLAKLLRVANQALTAGKAAAVVTQPANAAVPLLEPVGTSAAMNQLREQCQRAAQHQTTVLLTGEPGVGKSFAARYIQALSRQNVKPFVEVACGAMAEQPFAEELFGEDTQPHQPGLLEKAQNGAIYFNEIADLDLPAQGVLLGALEQKSYTRIGGGRRLPLQARVLASTQFDLLERIEEGLFREDLYYHLNVVPIRVPALREHADDVLELLKFYVDYFNTREGLPYRHFTLSAQNYLRYYSWPGNVRQLRNLVQRLLIMGEGAEISQSEVEEALVRDRVAQAQLIAGLPMEVMELPLREAREIFEREYLSRQLELCKGNVSRMAERVGMERTHLYRKMRSLGITPKKAG